MPSIATRPLIAVSVFVPTILLLGYLWQRRRAEEVEVNSPPQGLGAIDSREFSLKLESLNRSRLDCIEEEKGEDTSEDKAREKESLKDSRVHEKESSPTEEVEYPGEKIVELSSAVSAIEPSVDLVEAVPVAPSVTDFESCETVAVVFEESNITETFSIHEVTVLEEVEESQHNSLLDEASQEDEETAELSIMTERTVATVEFSISETLPDVFTALQDPISPLSTSPVKSESSQRSSEAWSDLIEQDEQEVLEKQLSEKLTNLDICSESARNDSGVASPTEEFSRSEGGRKDGDTKSRISSGEDAGIGSVGSDAGEVSDPGHCDVGVEDTQLLSYHFYMQDYLCGTFIGAGGASINKLKSTCDCNIILKDGSKANNQKRAIVKSRDRRYGEGKLNLCIIEGTRANIDKCLDIIKERFAKHPELTLEQINKPESANLSLYNGSVTLSLAEGIMHDVYISSVINGGHIFIQQPTHPTFPALERLDSCMHNTYSQFTCPQLLRPILPNSVCVANSNEGWYRCQVVSYDEAEDVCDVKYVDYGGYDTLPADHLRQIRTDFLSLPFQAIECYLANIVLTEEDTVSANILEELVAGQIVQARMIGLNEDGVPMVHLYRSFNGQTVMVNRELVDRSCAEWIEATIVPLSPSPLWNSLGDFSPSMPVSVTQIKHYENLINNHVGYPPSYPSPSPPPCCYPHTPVDSSYSTPLPLLSPTLMMCPGAGGSDCFPPGYYLEAYSPEVVEGNHPTYPTVVSQ